MTAEVRYKKKVYQDLKRIDKKEAIRIIDKLEKVLSKNPDKGIPLKGRYKGLYKLRIGNYRVRYYKIPTGVEIVRIEHRSQAYKD